MKPPATPSNPSPTQAANPPEAFFDAVYQSFRRALDAAGAAIDRHYSIAGQPVLLRAAGPALLPPIARALEHLRGAPIDEPALTICLWDSDSTGVPMPPPPWALEDFRQGGEIRGYTDARFYTGFQFGAGILSILDLERGLGVYWTKSAGQIPFYEIASPLRMMLHPWLSARGVVPVHAGAVGLPDGGVLLAGKGGSGKSNTALACLGSELLYVSDDFCLIRADPVPTAFSLYSTGKVLGQDMARLSLSDSMVWNRERPPEEKAVLFLNEHRPGRLADHFPLKAIFIIRVAGGSNTRLTPASPGAALTALAPGSLLLMPSSSAKIFRFLADTVRQIPCFYLDLGTAREQIPGTILDFLAAARSRPVPPPTARTADQEN